jgi:hypothetical protein
MARWARDMIEERTRNDPHPGMLERNYRIAVESVAAYLEALSQTWAIQPEDSPEDDYLLVARQKLEEAAGRSPMEYKPSGRELYVWADMVPQGGLTLPNPRDVLEALVMAAAEEVCLSTASRLSAVSKQENRMVQERAAAHHAQERLIGAEKELEEMRERAASDARRIEAAEEERDYWRREAKDIAERIKLAPYNGARETTPKKTAPKMTTRRKVTAGG